MAALHLSKLSFDLLAQTVSDKKAARCVKTDPCVASTPDVGAGARVRLRG